MEQGKVLECKAYWDEAGKLFSSLPIGTPEILDSMEKVPAALKEQKVSSVCVVTDKGILAAGLLDGLQAALTEAGIATAIYDGVVPNPTVANVEAAREVYLSHQCNGILALGGGSVMDCAKVMAARVAAPDTPVMDMLGLYAPQSPLPPFIAIPTTAGTGSETTIAAIITTDEDHRKLIVMAVEFIPAYAVLDPKLTLGLPKAITAATGMDALAHAVESYIGTFRTEYSDAKAIEAVQGVKAYLKRAYDNGADETAREGMLLASHNAGISFTRGFVGYVHSIAHTLGSVYNMPHGLAIAITMPYVLEACGESIYESLGDLAIRCGIAPAGAQDKEAALAFIDWVKELNASMGIPSVADCLKEEDIPAMAAMADEEANPTYPVPLRMDAEELAAIYRKMLP